MSNENWLSDGSSSNNNNNSSTTTAANINSSSCDSSPRLLRHSHNTNTDDISNADPFYTSATCSAYNHFLPSDDEYFSTFNPCINDILLTTNTNSLSISPSSDDLSFDHFSDAIAAQNRLNQASCVLEDNQFHEYSLCLSALHKSIKQLNALRQENESLRLANADLISRINILSQANCIVSSSRPYHKNDDYTSQNGQVLITKSSVSPTSVIQQNSQHHKFSTVLPKSISVQSSHHAKTNNQHGGPTEHMNRANPICNSYQQRVRTLPHMNQPRRLHVGGEGEGYESENGVYNQGMQKTELCNKWQESGECPYGNNCRFAHGVAELRPVMRHPRYKTEICRMFLSGNMCPYGHRCHFRHSSITHHHDILQPHASFN